MATKKQQRRREKLQRHDYVYLDEEGNEVEPPASSTPTGRTDKAPAKPAAKQQARSTTRREPKPPSWPRAFKWAGGYAAAFLVLTLFTAKKGAAIGAIVIPVVFLGILMVPGMYMMHRLQYRTYQRMEAKQAGRKPPAKR